MKIALSTNWNSSRLATGEEIADEALSLGFDALELGFRLLPEQVAGIKSRLDVMPVDSVHAYSPVPISAPYGHPELHSIVSQNEDERSIASRLIAETVEFASSMGARVVVLHAGRVQMGRFLSPLDTSRFYRLLQGKEGEETLDRDGKAYKRLMARYKCRRTESGGLLMERFRVEIEKLSSVLEKNGVVLALENLPYCEAFPDEDEMEALAKDCKFLKAWFDTGHARVRASFGWSECEAAVLKRQLPYLAGCHINDVREFNDDHFAPGKGKVDFKALSEMFAPELIHVVEPSQHVTAEDLREGLEKLRKFA